MVEEAKEDVASDDETDEDPLVSATPGRGGLSVGRDSEAPPADTPAIEARSLNVYYGDVQAIQDVTMSI
ncbi:MAG: phosphate ABC transporter ATP-binding protein, partial [Halobacteriales archaeon]